MRIAIFTEVFPPKIDGISNRLSNTIRCMTDAGHEVLVFAPEGSVAELHGARVVSIAGPRFAPYPELRVSLPDPRIALELMRFRPQVVHAVGPVCLGLWGALSARALGLTVVASYHTDLPRYAPLHGLSLARPMAWQFVRRVHGLAQVNLCPSRGTLAELRAHGVGNLGLWRGGVDSDLFHPARRSVQMRWQLSAGRLDAPLLLYAGRLSPEKGLERLLPVLDALPHTQLALVGDGPGRAELEAHFAGRRVVFTGYLRGEKLASAFASADAFVMPSTTETLGFVALEAMAAGVPVVAADAGGLPDLVRDGETGLLFDPDDPAQLVCCVRRVLEERDLARSLAISGRKHAQESSWPEQTARLVDIYSEAVRQHRRSTWTGRLLGCPPPAQRSVNLL